MFFRQIVYYYSVKRNCLYNRQLNKSEFDKGGQYMNTLQMIRIMLLVVFGFGVKELWSANQYYKEQKKKWAIASLCVGTFACICAILGLTGII